MYIATVRQCLLGAALLCLAGAALPGVGGTRMTWMIDGVERQAVVFAPMSSNERSPVVLAFHGHGGNMNLFADRAKIQDRWPDAVVVYPQGLPTVTLIDPQGREPGWQIKAGQDNDRDLRFVDAILARLRERYSVDDSRVYAMGFSNGGFFSYLLWSQRPKTFAAFGICSARLAPGVSLSRAKPAFIIAGRKDEIVPFGMQEEAIEAARQVDGATGGGQSQGGGVTLYPSSMNAPVMTLIHDGGHVFEESFTAGIVNFFKEQTQNP